MKQTFKNSLRAQLKKINIKNFIDWAADACDAVSPNILKKSWKKLWPSLAYEDDSSKISTEVPDLLQLVQTISRCEEADKNDVDEWVSNKVENNQKMADSETTALVQNDAITSDSSDKSERPENEEKNISHATAFAAAETLLSYVEWHCESTAANIMLLRRWQNLATSSRRAAFYQMKVTDFLL